MTIRGAGVILRDKANRILLVLGRNHDKWSFPKGHLESKDPSPEECAMRETKEETGLTVDIPTGTERWTCHQYIYYLIGPDQVTEGWHLQPEDHNEVAYAKWFTVTEIMDLRNGNIAVRKFCDKLRI